MTKKVLLISQDSEWRKGLAKEFRRDLEISVAISQSRADAISIISSDEVYSIVLDDTYTIKDIEIIFKYLKASKSNIHVFFLSKQFENFKELLDTFKDFKIIPLNAPMIFSDIYEQVLRTALPPNPNSQIDKNLRINIEFLKIFTDSTKKILFEFCNLQNIQHEKPRLMNKGEELHSDIRGSIELSSEFFEGNYNIHFKKDIYLKIVNSLLMSNDTEINNDNKDFAGEIVNMIYGQAKMSLNLGGYNFQKAFPSFLMTPPPLIVDSSTVLLPINFDDGFIQVSIEIKKMAGYVL